MTNLLEVLGNARTLVVPYFGLLAIPQKPRYRSSIDTSILSLFKELSKKMNIVIVTSRSCETIINQVGFASAIVCCNGCEIVVEDRIVVPRDIAKMSHVIAHLQRKAQQLSRVIVEVRKISLGDMVGLGLEWEDSIGKADAEIVESLVRIAQDNNLLVYELQDGCCIDIFLPRCRRDEAMKFLSRCVERPIVYIAEGPYDQNVSKYVDVVIGLRHEYNKSLSFETDLITTRVSIIDALRKLLIAR